MSTRLSIGKALHNLATADPALFAIDGITADASELNILDGATVTVEELNILDGVTATTAQINTLAGLTEGVALALGEPVENIVDAKADYDTGGLDNEAKIIAALNATNGAINSILAALIEFGIMEAE